MNPQNNNYIATPFSVSNDRYIYDNRRLGGRTITSNIIDGKRYFSSLDAEIYFGGINSKYIDELLQINWAVEQATLPLFGYNSYTFDDLAVGARQVSGSFVINFTKSGYLYELLRSIDGVNRASFYENIPPEENINWKTKFDKHHTASWDKSFNIIVGYGDHKNQGFSTSLTLIECVQLTSCQQILSVDGTPIAESYTFIAKDIRYENTMTSGDGTENIPPSTEIEKDDNTKNNFIFSANSISLERIEYTKVMPEDPKYSFVLHIDNAKFTNGIPKNIMFNFFADSNKSISKIDLKKEFTKISDIEKIYVPDPNINNLALDIEKYLISLDDIKVKNKYVYLDIIIEYGLDGSDGTFKFILSKQKVKVTHTKK